MPKYSPKMYFFRSHAYKCHPIQQHISACFFRSRSWADLSTRPLFEFWWFEVLKRVHLPSAPRFLDFDSLQREDVFIDRLSQTNSKQSEAPTYGVLRYFSNSSHAKSGRKRSKNWFACAEIWLIVFLSLPWLKYDLSTRPLFEFWWFEVLKRVHLPSAPRFLDFDSLQREDVFIDRLSQTNSKQSEAPTYGVLRYFSNSSHAKSGRKRSKNWFACAEIWLIVFLSLPWLKYGMS